MRRVGAWAAALFVSAAAVAGAEPPRAAEQPSFAALYERFAVAADHPLASAAGAEILRTGGNAVDAAVATSFALSVVRPFSCGLGGGGFMVIHLADDGTGRRVKPLGIALNYREMTPQAIGPKFYETRPASASTIGGLAVGVPGTVAGLLHALEKHGTMKRADVMAPAIRLAREGFEVDAAYKKMADELIEKFNGNPAWKREYAFVWTRFLGSGSIEVGRRIVMNEQAQTLELIARDGAKAFYDGPIADAIIDALKAHGGVMTRADLRRFRVADGPPLTFTFDGKTFITMPLPSSGGIAMAEMLGILERRKIKEISARGAAAGEAMPTEFAWAFIEAMKHAFADRARWLGDPASAADAPKRLLAPHYLDALAMSIRPGRTSTPAAYGSGWTLTDDGDVIPEDGGTSHISVVDAQGNAVACTETINLEFGSLVAVDKYGFVLNNQMDDFTTRSGGAGQGNAFGLVQSEKNRPGPGLRPLSSMSPTIVLDTGGKVIAVAGASGGPRIISATTLVLLNALVLGMPADRAVASGRVHHQWMPDVLRVEDALRGERSQGLEMWAWFRKGHYQVEPMTSGAAVQAIVREGAGTGTRWHAASDPRKGGAPAGE